MDLTPMHGEFDTCQHDEIEGGEVPNIESGPQEGRGEDELDKPQTRTTRLRWRR